MNSHDILLSLEKPVADRFGAVVFDVVITTEEVSKYNSTLQYRPISELLKHECLESLKGCPVIVGHTSCDAESMSETKSLGTVYDPEYYYDDNIKGIRGKIKIFDTTGLDLIQNQNFGEVSVCFHSDDIKTSGIFNSDVYDEVQTNIRFQHVALIPNGLGREQGKTVIKTHMEELGNMDNDFNSMFKQVIMSVLSEMGIGGNGQQGANGQQQPMMGMDKSNMGHQNMGSYSENNPRMNMGQHNMGMQQPMPMANGGMDRNKMMGCYSPEDQNKGMMKMNSAEETPELESKIKHALTMEELRKENEELKARFENVKTHQKDMEEFKETVKEFADFHQMNLDYNKSVDELKGEIVHKVLPDFKFNSEEWSTAFKTLVANKKLEVDNSLKVHAIVKNPIARVDVTKPFDGSIDQIQVGGRK